MYLRLIENIELSPNDLKEMMKDASDFVQRMKDIIEHFQGSKFSQKPKQKLDPRSGVFSSYPTD